MNSVRTWVRRALGVFARRRQDLELADELRSHLAAHIDDNIRAGMTPDEARRSAYVALGGIQQTAEAYRDRRGVPAVEVLVREARYALRTLRKSPGFTSVAILTLALGLGATTTIFSVVNGVLLEPLKYRDPERLYLGRMHADRVAKIASSFPVNARHFHEWRTRCRSCEEVALVEGRGFTLTGSGEPERLPGLQVSYNFFRALGSQPALGRDFRPEEELPGRSHVVILSDSLWRNRFGGDPSIVNRTIDVDGEPNTVIGVAPPELHLPKGAQWGPLFAHDLVPLMFRPLGFDPAQSHAAGEFNYAALVRLRRGVDPRQASDEMNADIADLSKQYGLAAFGWKAILIPLREQMTGSSRQSLWLLLGAVGAVLLIICVNVGNLMLVRAVSKQREAGIRLALGVSRFGLFGLVFNEALIVVAVGGALGVVFAFAGVRLLAIASVDLPRIEDVQLDWRVLWFTVTTAVASTALCGLLPAWRLARSQPHDSLRTDCPNATEGRQKRRLSEVLVAFEVALSALLLVVGGLLMSSFFRLLHVNKGFDVEHIVTQGVSLISPAYRNPTARTRFIDDALARLAGIAGVRSVGVVNQVPLHGETWIDDLADADRPKRADEFAGRTANFRFVSPAYWKTMGISLKQGRAFEASDRSHLVAVLSETAAQYLWPGLNPLGRHVQATGRPAPSLEVVGVVADVREGLAKAPPAMVYEPYWLIDVGGPSFVLRTAAPPAAVAAAIRDVIHAIDANVPVTPIQTMEQVVDESVAAPRFEMKLAVAFALSALVLASLGIYGVLAFTVARRTQEIGIRIALGARSSQVMTLVLQQGLRPVTGGLIVGLLVALIGGRILSSQLFGISPTDPATMAGVAALLLAVSLCACWFPARRAIAIDPTRALREQ
jgi:predicted permease